MSTPSRTHSCLDDQDPAWLPERLPRTATLQHHRLISRPIAHNPSQSYVFSVPYMIVLDIYIFASESRSARVTQYGKAYILFARYSACSVCPLEQGPCMVQENNDITARDLPTRLVYLEPNFVLGRQAIRIGMQSFPRCNVLLPPWLLHIRSGDVSRLAILYSGSSS